MLFNSFEFAVFFPLVVVLYFLLPYRWRWLLLLLASYVFYMWWRVEYAVLLVISTAVDYTAALRIGAAKNGGSKKLWLSASIITNLGILVSFKYFNFFSEAFFELANGIGWDHPAPVLDVLLPMGISFYTFQTMSYTIDVYRGRMEPTRDLGRFALYVTFFPQLVAGPIERAPSLLPQFFQDHDPQYERIVAGLKQMAWGFFKKLVIADRVAIIVEHIYSDPTQHDGTTLLVATYLFAFQIYCDFSGYSDIAIGAARVMGFDLMENFRTPYGAHSIREFWARWHISLSTWFRDYLYIPLGGNRVAKWRWYLNLFLVFAISGLWHGANWTFIVWGALHGAYLILALVFEPVWDGLARKARFSWDTSVSKWIRRLATFHLVLLSWVFFRAASIGDSMEILHRITSAIPSTGHLLATARELRIDIFMVTVLCALVFVMIDPWMDGLAKGKFRLKQRGMEHVVFAAVVMFTVLLGQFGEAEFIYFQF